MLLVSVAAGQCWSVVQLVGGGDMVVAVVVVRKMCCSRGARRYNRNEPEALDYQQASRELDPAPTALKKSPSAWTLVEAKYESRKHLSPNEHALARKPRGIS